MSTLDIVTECVRRADCLTKFFELFSRHFKCSFLLFSTVVVVSRSISTLTDANPFDPLVEKWMTVEPTTS
jgi:hypothetical protein